MAKITSEQLQRHLKTHTERSNDDKNAITMLRAFLRSDGKINPNFAEGDKWPNIDGTFELVPAPECSRRPKQNFVVQIKGTSSPTVSRDGTIRYQLQNLAFPAYVATEVTLDPGILFLVVNPGKRNQERVFWKYMSYRFIAGIDFTQNSAVIHFTPEDEIENTEEAVDAFVRTLDSIADSHSFIKQLEPREYTREDLLRPITVRCQNISDAIKTGVLFADSRDRLSRRIWTELKDLCEGTLLLNAFRYYSTVNLRIAWETAVTDIETKFLSNFLLRLRYIGLRVPEDGQYERLMVKYYSFLWKIRKYLREVHQLSVLENLEDFPRRDDSEDTEYNRQLAIAIESINHTPNPLCQNRYYVQKSVPFYVEHERYFEITLQLAGKYATKYNRFTVYSKLDISSNYSIQFGYTEAPLLLWDTPSKIKVITNWQVSIDPPVLNRLAKLLRIKQRLSSVYKEYQALMEFLTRSGISLLDLIDFRDERFFQLLSRIYDGCSTSHFKEVLTVLHRDFGEKSTEFGRHTVRYLLIHLREELLEDLLPYDEEDALNSRLVYLSKGCYSFELNPILYNLPNRKTNGKSISHDVLRALGSKKIPPYLPYIRIKHLIDTTGELFYPREQLEYPQAGQTIEAYNAQLTDWDRRQGLELKVAHGYVYLDEYVRDSVHILQKLLGISASGNAGQQALNRSFISHMDVSDIDDAKLQALEKAFVDSGVLMIYGAAGTGKTTLMNHLSNLMDGRSKLFLAKTHTAKENLKKRIQAPGIYSSFMSVDQFVRSSSCDDYDIVFVDECSTIDNRTMVQLLAKIGPDSLLVLAGDIYQIESIDFGNWFFYAREIMPPAAVAELTSTWRTQEKSIQDLWEAVRFVKPLIMEMLVIDGPFSENIGPRILEKTDEDEVVLCLNYDGKFGLNSINSYFQNANPSQKVYTWSEWTYKVGDRILFNENRRFPLLYNNLKGVIVDIEAGPDYLTFTIDIPILLTALHLRGTELEWISGTEDSTRIRFSVYETSEESVSEADYEEERLRSIVPFQLAYAVSIHKAQGLEYNSIKVVIPSSSSERITHGIFYTAITRTKQKLKLFWSTDTMNQIIDSFTDDREKQLSLHMIKAHFLGMEDN